MGSPQQRISPSKESRSRQIRNPKTQENQHLPTAFLHNRILTHVKSQRQINRFRILHGRRLRERQNKKAGVAAGFLFRRSANLPAREGPAPSARPPAPVPASRSRP